MYVPGSQELAVGFDRVGEPNRPERRGAALCASRLRAASLRARTGPGRRLGRGRSGLPQRERASDEAGEDYLLHWIASCGCG